MYGKTRLTNQSATPAKYTPRQSERERQKEEQTYPPAPTLGSVRILRSSDASLAEEPLMVALKKHAAGGKVSFSTSRKTCISHSVAGKAGKLAACFGRVHTCGCLARLKGTSSWRHWRWPQTGLETRGNANVESNEVWSATRGLDVTVAH